MAAEDPIHEPPIAPTRFRRLAAAIDLSPTSGDAAVLAAALGGPDADVLLIAIEPDLALLVPPADEPRVRHETERLVANVRSAYVPDA